MPPRPAEPRQPLHHLLSIGFRPFYVAGAAFALVAMLLWYVSWRGWITLSSSLPGMAWHAHEMVFGFAPAIIAGFLLTAVRAWTGRSTPSGVALAALVMLWGLGRVLMASGPGIVAAVVDVAFLPVLAAVLTVPLWRSGNRRNAFVVPLLLALAALSALHHAAHGSWLSPQWGPRAITAALDLVALLIAVIGGRVIPAFAANAIPGLAPRRWPPVEALSIGLLVVIAILDASGWAAELASGLFPLLLLTAGIVHLIRLAGWRPWATRGNILLLALPLAYLWLPVHLLMRGWLDTGGSAMPPLALHALSVGAMSGMMLAMMTRSALGHSGRALTAGAAEIIMFSGVHLAALARTGGPLLWPGGHVLWMSLAAGAWSVAFAAFALRYAPIVLGPRVSGA